MQKVRILKSKISLATYEKIISIVFKSNTNYLVSPIASQTLVKAHFDKNLEKVLDKFDYLVPDSQWLRWSIFFLYGKKLKTRIYGPELMLKICAEAGKRNSKIFLYGNKRKVLNKLIEELKLLCPTINIAGSQPSKFSSLTKVEKEQLVSQIVKSNARILFICLGSPLQEIFSEEISRIFDKKKKKIVIIPVGAAFDFISKIKHQAPKWVQNIGFEWLFRLINEPKRLWRRYLILGPLFMLLVLKQKLLYFADDIITISKI